VDKGQIQEALVTLYLRLNGYFTSGFIVHSPQHGKNKAEIDILAVRFPGNAEPERGVDIARELGPSKTLIDVVVAEVKSRGQQLRFNESLRTDPAAVASVLRWVGLFSEIEIPDLTGKLVGALDPQHPSAAEPPTVEGPRKTRVRGLLFSPERDSRRDNQPWFLPGPPLLTHLWHCLRPPTPRAACATTYDFGLWGRELEPVVRCFKDAVQQPNTFRDLCDEMASVKPPS
jgi:hypothetical protein